MLLRILHQVYHTQIKAVARLQHSTMYTLERSLAASKVEEVHQTQIEQAEPGSQTQNSGVKTAKRASNGSKTREKRRGAFLHNYKLVDHATEL